MKILYQIMVWKVFFLLILLSKPFKNRLRFSPFINDNWNQSPLNHKYVSALQISLCQFLTCEIIIVPIIFNNYRPSIDSNLNCLFFFGRVMEKSVLVKNPIKIKHSVDSSFCLFIYWKCMEIVVFSVMCIKRKGRVKWYTFHNKSMKINKSACKCNKYFLLDGDVQSERKCIFFNQTISVTDRLTDMLV